MSETLHDEQSKRQAAIITGRLLQGAGILTYSIHPETQQLHVLLGRENDQRSRNRRMRGWCDFGGCCRRSNSYSGYETAAETASREFIEETCNCIPFMRKDVCGLTVPEVVTCLLSGRYDFAIVNRGPRSKKSYVCFVNRIEWDAELPARFANVRSVLQKMYHDASKLRQLSKRLQGWPYLKPGMTLSGQASIVRQVHSAVVSQQQKDKVVLEVDVETCDSVTCNFCERKWHTMYFDAGSLPAQLDCYLQWVQLRKQVIDSFEQLPLNIKQHPAVHVVKKYGYTYSISVNQDYLEKSEIRWWSQDEIQRTLNTREAAPFRACFRNVLAACMQQLQRPKLVHIVESQEKEVEEQIKK